MHSQKQQLNSRINKSKKIEDIQRKLTRIKKKQQIKDFNLNKKEFYKYKKKYL